MIRVNLENVHPDIPGTAYYDENIEDKARELGYKRIYLETHDCLEAAIHVYRKTGYREIEKPKGLVHATMNKFFIKEL